MAQTTDKGTKAKAPAKPRAAKPATAKSTAAKAVAVKAASKVKAAQPTVAEKVIATTPTHDEVAHLARQYWADRGHQHGHHEQDWHRAEQELRKKAS